MSIRTLNYLLYALGPDERYTSFDLRKRSGGVRRIKAPIRRVKEAQRLIASWLVTVYRPRPCVFGYVDGRNIQMNADCHIRKTWLLRVDLKDFFPSIHFGRVRGMFMAKPLSLNKEVATILAQFCCDGSALPQGSPASPIISNIISRGLDATLIRLANRNQCHYTRYCDDLVFSTTRRHFPAALASFNPKEGTVTLGEGLVGSIEGARFTVNPEKTRLRNSGHRQMVTGLVTNARRNVPREYLRHLRVILHRWETMGEQDAATWYFSSHYKKNRPPKKKLPAFAKVVRGKVQYVGSVRGWGDDLYVTLSKRLAALDTSFVPKPSPPLAPAPPKKVGGVRPPLPVYVEGRSDKIHIEAALQMLQAAGQFPNLRLKVLTKGGSGNLKNLCRALCQHEQFPPVVFLFDSDDQGTVKEFTNSNGDPRDWNNNVHSMVLPTPSHRSTATGICIELLYQDADLKRPDANGRRLYLAAEFSKNDGRHMTETVYSTSLHKGTLVAESVFDFQTPSRSVGLGKVHFAQLVRSQAPGVVDISGFVPLFQKLDELSAVLLPY